MVRVLWKVGDKAGDQENLAESKAARLAKLGTVEILDGSEIKRFPENHPQVVSGVFAHPLEGFGGRRRGEKKPAGARPRIPTA